MKIKFEFDDNLTDTEIVIKAAEDTAEIQRLAQLLEANATTVPKFTFYKDDSEYYLSLNTILFFETDERAVHAHTATMFLPLSIDCMSWNHRSPIVSFESLNQPLLT